MNTIEAQNINDGSVVYVSLPRIDELNCAICEIDLTDLQDSLAKSNFHWQTIKCRLLIHTVPDIIASPILGTGFIFVIAKKNYCTSGELLTALKSLKLTYSGFQPLTRQTYKVCLTYTIECKMAPSWTKIGEYLVEGKDFYNSILGSKAIKLNIIMGDISTSFQLRAEKIKIPCAKLEDFNLPDSIMADFLSDPKSCIDLPKSERPHVHVLPSMKQGKVLSVSNEISADSLFKDYEQLRNHWKNMYGYILPESDAGILYYSIKFLIPRSDTFTYPNICITSGPPINIPARNNEATIQQFLSDMFKAVPAICGHRFEVIQNGSPDSLNIETACTPSFANGIILNDKRTTANKRKQNEPSASLSLGFSHKYLNPLASRTNIAVSHSKASASGINETRNAALAKVANSNLDNIIADNRKVLATKSKSAVVVRVNETRNVNHVPIQRVETGISKYFKLRKPHLQINNKQPQMEDAANKNQNQRKLTIKERLQNARQCGSTSFLGESSQNLEVEAMAKNNKLGELTNAALSDWLKRHSIPHNPHQRKGDLINKVLSHLRNTRILHAFRNM